MLSDEAKQTYTTALDTAQARLIDGALSAPASRGAVPAQTQEAAQIIARVEVDLPEIQRQDPIFYRDCFYRIEKMWKVYVRSTNLCGLADVADLALRFR